MKTLTEEPRNGSERWRDLTSAMDRQAVGDALNALPEDQKQIFKLAFFSGLTNRDIADRLGLRVSDVRRRLRQALATVSSFVERGRAVGSKVIYALIAWITGRWIYSTEHLWGDGVDQMVRVGMVVVAGVTAGAVLGAAQSPAQLARIDQASVPAVKSTAASVAQASKTTILAASSPLPILSVVGGGPVQEPGRPPLPVEVRVPSVPDLPQPVRAPRPPISQPIPSPTLPALPKL